MNVACLLTVVAERLAARADTAVLWSPRHPQPRRLQFWEQAPWFLRQLRAPMGVEGPLLVLQQRWDSTTLRDTTTRVSTLLQRATTARTSQHITDPVLTTITPRDSAVTVRQDNGGTWSHAYGACTSSISVYLCNDSQLHWLVVLSQSYSVECLFVYAKVKLFWIR
jgi:hypothetical protein